MKHVNILICTLILILNSCSNVKGQNSKDIKVSKIYDTDSVLLIENYAMGGEYIKSFWYTKTGNKYSFRLSPYEKQVKLFKTPKDYDDFLYENHIDTQSDFIGVYYAYLLVSKKGKIVEGRIIHKTEGCKECDELALRTIDIMKKKIRLKSRKTITIVDIAIPFGKLYN